MDLLAARGGLDVARVFRGSLEALDKLDRVLSRLIWVLTRNFDVAAPARLASKAA
jgi:hypothetical protein|eukprot:COSAG02_NODE_7525_length_2974_cov_2.205565_5_plen_55_part_00